MKNITWLPKLRLSTNKIIVKLKYFRLIDFVNWELKVLTGNKSAMMAIVVSQY